MNPDNCQIIIVIFARTVLLKVWFSAGPRIIKKKASSLLYPTHWLYLLGGEMRTSENGLMLEFSLFNKERLGRWFSC